MQAELQNVRAELHQTQRRLVVALNGKGHANPKFEEGLTNKAGPSGEVEGVNLLNTYKVHWEDHRQGTPPGVAMDDI